MANIVVFTARKFFQARLETECKSITGSFPVVKNSLDELLSFLKLKNEVTFLIVDEVPKRVMSSITIPAEVRYVLVLQDEAPEALEALLRRVKSVLGATEANAEGYISIPVESLSHFRSLPFDLYLKLAEGKYVKRIPANEEFDSEIIRSFRTKGLKELHFDKRHNRDFSSMLLKNMMNKVKSQYLSDDEKFKATSEVFITTRAIVQSVGLPPRVVQICESVMERISEDVTANRGNLANYINELKTASNLNFQFRFIELSCFFATQIMDVLNDGAKEAHIKTIVFASFFCDISLKNPVHLEYRSEESLEHISPDEKLVICDHAIKSCEIVLKYKNAPALAAEVIKQHHGSIDGHGFPKHIQPELLPLANSLFAAQELAFSILKNLHQPAHEVVSAVTRKYENTPLHSYLKLFESNLIGR